MNHEAKNDRAQDVSEERSPVITGRNSCGARLATPRWR
jgi:hypothetical protein